MIMLKNTILIIIFFLTTSCGYEAVHSEKNSKKYNFSITSINFEGDRDVNLKIKQKFNNYVRNKKDKQFQLSIKSTSTREILAKDGAGNSTSFKNTIIVYVEIFLEDNLKNNLQLVKSFKYNNITNKFDLKKYERELKMNLAESISDELIFKLSKIQ
tara:strand:- start:230 stop:700 length:471 start_codon:yes stop_codon:yes gene_type:complete